jgi:hypothetical protein
MVIKDESKSNRENKMQTKNTKTLEAAQYFTAEIPEGIKRICLEAIENHENDMRFIKEKLLKKAEKQEPQYFKKIDCYVDFDYVRYGRCSDSQSDYIYSFGGWNLINIDSEVSVFIREDAKEEDVLRLLIKTINYVQHDFVKITADAYECRDNIFAEPYVHVCPSSEEIPF